MKVLVIGASSFTGSHFCTYARAKGAEVEEVSLRNLHETVAALRKEPEYVVNFAALNVVAPSWSYPSDYLYTNVYALLGIVDYLKDKPLKRFVQVSTPEVFGSSWNWIKEGEPYNPSTPYAVSRAAAEMLLNVYRREYVMPIVVTRGCNVYGPGQQLYRLIPKVIASIKRKAVFPLEGGGASKRAFLYVDDMVAGIWTAMMAEEPYFDYHISSHELQSIKAVAGYICEKMRVNFDDVIGVTDERPGKDAAYMLDSGRIRALGWEDQVSMDKGLDAVIAHMDKISDLNQLSLTYEHKP